MQYELGKQYEMNVVDIRKDSAGNDYIALHDDDPYKEYRIYNILKCQFDELPKTLYVKVKSIDSFGKVKLVQDEARLVKEHYEIGKLYAFEVTDVREDFNSKAPYYIIEDDFKEHHYYYQGEQKYNVGGHCILEVEGFTDKGFLKFKEVKHVDSVDVESAIESPMQNRVVSSTETSLSALWADRPVLEGIDEGQTCELKRSIVYPAGGDNAPNIDKQISVIIKELTAFMNTDGGVLYIGVHDKTKKVIGIQNDFAHLKEGEEDQYADQYSHNIDGYELKIRNTVDKYCQCLANSLITFEFPELGGYVYCKITVKAARRPIFFKGTQLCIRQGNRIKTLKGDEITFFITERMTISIKEVLDTDDIVVNNNGGFDVEAMKKAMQDLINERRAIPTDLPTPRKLEEIDYWIIWYDNATWKRSRNRSEEVGVYIQVPVYKAMSDPIVAFCYKSGKVNTMKLSEFRKGVNLDRLQNNGWYAKESPANIFIMHASDFLVGYSIDSNGIESVKLHSISDYATTKSAANQGSPFTPDGCVIKTFATLGAEHKKKVEHLIVTKSLRSRNAGTPLASLPLKDEIEYLEKTLTEKG